MDGNMNEQIQKLQEKCNNINGSLAQVYMSQQDAKQGYTTVFIPSIRYVLPTTTIQQKVLTKMQIPITNTVLTKMGFNRHMPRAVVFAPLSIGGIGLIDLYTAQSESKIITILTNIRAQTPVLKTIIILIESYQISAGITYQSVENNIITHNYMQSPWMAEAREFLKTIKGYLYIPQIQTIQII
jgi:hypothetical protein